MEPIFMVDIFPIKDLPGEIMEIQEEIDFPDLTGAGNRLLKFINPWDLKCQVTNINKGFQVIGKIEGYYELVCDRCLKNFKSYLETEIFDNFLPVHNSYEQEEEERVFSGAKIDLTPTLLEAINLKIPIKNLCSQDCHGLCPVCGVDLNFKTCDCQKETFDPRLAKLLKWKELEGGGSGGQSKR